MDELAQELIEFLKEASPVVWAAFVRQAYIVAGAKFFWAIGLIMTCILLVLIGNYDRRTKNNEDLFVFIYFIAIIVGIVAFGLIVSALMWALNSDYYAIQLILRQLGQ